MTPLDESRPSTPVRRNGLMLGLLIGGLLSITFGLGFLGGATYDRKQLNASANIDNPDVRNFLSAYKLVSERSYFRPFNKHQLIYAAIDGMLSATGDPHTVYLPPADNTAANRELNGQQFSGIGAIVVPSRSTLHIVAALPNSPAARAGLMTGDTVISIDGHRVSSLGARAISHIHGRAGTTVALLIVRSGEKPFTVRVQRAVIPAVTAYGAALHNGIGYIQIVSFGDKTASEVRGALLRLQAAHVRGIVLDMRQNPGGYVDAAQSVVSDFIGHGVVAYEKRSNGTLAPLGVTPGQRVVNVPVAVLVDSGTASAAEITAAALREEDHAVLLGTKTYGKGSMQSVYNLSDGSTIRLTDRLWLTPRKESISQVGLKPDISIPVSGGQGPFGDDPQLAAAETLLLKPRRS